MTYESPITLITTQTDNYIKEINEKTDEVIFKAVVNVLPQVDRDELVKALAYDREQYSKGYKDRDSEIVRCKDCRWYDNKYGDVCHNPRYGDGHANYQPPYVDENYWLLKERANLEIKVRILEERVTEEATNADDSTSNNIR